jgi:hypothetical protein
LSVYPGNRIDSEAYAIRAQANRSDSRSCGREHDFRPSNRCDAAIHDWTAQKLEERNVRSAVKSQRQARTASVFPAVATQRGETWTDPDEISDLDIPREYQNQGANAVFVTRGDSMIDAGGSSRGTFFLSANRGTGVSPISMWWSAGSKEHSSSSATSFRTTPSRS